MRVIRIDSLEYTRKMFVEDMQKAWERRVKKQGMITVLGNLFFTLIVMVSLYIILLGIVF